MKNIKLLLIRHSITEGNQNKRYIGQKTDEPLCDVGVKMANDYKLVYDGFYSDNGYSGIVYTSSLKRSIQTAQILFPDSQICRINEFNEIDFGDFENKNYLELSDNPDYQAFIDSNGQIPFPNGETREAFIYRNYKAFMNIILENEIDTVNPLAMVIHGGSIMAIMSSLTGRDYFDFQLGCCEAYLAECRISKEKIDVSSYCRIDNRSSS